MTKPFDIPKVLLWKAFQCVKANGGAGGVDRESIEQFENRLGDNLYKLWNRLCSGSYFPPPVKGVMIPKKSGGTRMLGVPTVADRVAQTVVKLLLEPRIDPLFHPNSYGYRSGRSAHDAIALVRRRSWDYDWVVDFDIKGLFDNIDHGLLMRALKLHCQTPWVLLYVERWLKAPMQTSDGELQERMRGTPQGGVVSPLLANLFLHYAFDVWVTRNLRSVRFCRYADDGLIHCKSLAQAKLVLARIGERFRACGLELHPDKTRIVYCQDVKVLSWRLSNTLDADFCVAALEEALEKYGIPEIFNTDQGCQFSSFSFTGLLKDNGIRISMDGRGSWRDNIMVERLWRTLKYENIYLYAYESGSEARSGIGAWLYTYNTKRGHRSLDDYTPDEVYNGIHLLNGPDSRKGEFKKAA